MDVSSIRFRDKQHENLFVRWSELTDKTDDPEYSALFYLLALDDVTRTHIQYIFDFDDCMLISAYRDAGFWTSSSLQVFRLAVNLFNGRYFDIDSDGDPVPYSEDRYSPLNIFYSSYFPFFVQAMRIRFRGMNVIGSNGKVGRISTF